MEECGSKSALARKKLTIVLTAIQFTSRRHAQQGVLVDETKRKLIDNAIWLSIQFMFEIYSMEQQTANR
ncbi:CLUMA_CG020564, isoform A [Clunio marinus]|uniref:CLUMA_CG020564, isoform A n=1 Tax=Clunio marinus TaxID=568069 RepID=A0A1J1J5D4_9DIPT|nr:CLUMA_CG020564, isoform A [Clunio marinus]